MINMSKGFTLVELMITLAVLAIIATIGYPLYNQQMEKARRLEARSGLGKLAMAQERHYAMFGNYATTVAQLNFGPDGVEDGVNDTYAFRSAVADIDYDGDGNPDNYTIILATDGDATTEDYTFTATTAGDQTGDDDCALFTIDQFGQKAAEDIGGVDQSERCW